MSYDKIDLLKIVPREYAKKYIDYDSDWMQTSAINQYEQKVAIKRKLFLNSQFFYNLGLWIGDKYIYGNSVGITNISLELINEFHEFVKSLIKDSAQAKIKSINNNTAKRVVVNSAILRRTFQELEKITQKLIKSEDELIAYLSGKIDADGTIMPYNLKWKTGFIKITYGNESEIIGDLSLLRKFGLNGYNIKYKDRNAFDLKMDFNSSLKIFNKLVLKHSQKKEKLFLIGSWLDDIARTMKPPSLKNIKKIKE